LTVRDVYRTALRTDADIYHFHDPELIPAGLMLKLRGKKVIADIHEDYPDYIRTKEYIPRLLRIPAAWAVGMLERFSSGFFDGVIVVTPKIYSRFVKLNKHTVTVHNFPILKEFAGTADTDELAPKTDTVAYIGNITCDRGIIEMIKAIGIVNKKRSVKLVLGGSFAPKSLEDEVREMPEFEYVDYRGFLSRAEVSATLASARAGLAVPQPYSHNMFGYMNKLFEYMSAGIPIVAADFPQWRPIVEGSGCGLLVDSLDPEAIAEAIRYLFEHPDEAAKMGENGKAAVRKTFNWENEKAVLLKLYKTVLQGNKKMPAE
jgi:glycosyltransferase involved in cell wall biosynthesis